MHKLKKVADYVFEKQIGQGQFGEVFRARHLETGRVFAIKVLKKATYADNRLMRRQLKLEAEVMGRARHPHLMRLHRSFETGSNYYLVLDYCRHGDLQQFMARHKVRHFSEAEAIRVLAQIRDAFAGLRAMDVMHCDLKLENVFVRDGGVVLGDFGSVKVARQMASVVAGTLLYMAPELLAGSEYGAECDLWSIGVLFYQLVIGKPPFFGFSIGELKARIMRHSGQGLRFRGRTHLCGRVKGFLRAILEPDPRKRMTWGQFAGHEIFGSAHLSTCGSIASCRIGDYLPKGPGGQEDLSLESK